MGWGDTTLTGSPAKTPELTEMAQSPHTLVFERFYSQPICSPARAALLTGRAPSRTCIYSVEQHILAHGETTIATAAKRRGYRTFFAGKWHLGSLSNDSHTDCYRISGPSEQCYPGYVKTSDQAGSSVCCFGQDGHLGISNPLYFGFDEFVATPQCGASATTNCGCFQQGPSPASGCIVGHYIDACTTCNRSLECAQYYHGRAGGVSPWGNVSGDDDQEFLVDQLIDFASEAADSGEPFLAVVAFHGVHIPYVATEPHRAPYANLSLNEQDYYGTLSSISAQVGRVRDWLRANGLDGNTWVSFTSDNGPEVTPANGQGTGKPFPNPGSTGGLRGRKRDLTEGGIRVPGLVEYPPLIRRNVRATAYAASTMDYHSTVLDLLGLDAKQTQDGASLVPFMKNAGAAADDAGQGDSDATPRPDDEPIGHYGVFGYGSTRNTGGNFTCPGLNDKSHVPNAPEGYSAPGHQRQFSWSEGHLKLFGCESPDKNWHLFLYNVTADRAESTDLWKSRQAEARDMLGRFTAWQATVESSAASVC